MFAIRLDSRAFIPAGCGKLPEDQRPVIRYRPALAGEYTDAQIYAWSAATDGRGGEVITRLALEHIVADCIVSIDNVGFEKDGELAPIVWHIDSPIDERIATIRKLPGPWFNALMSEVQASTELTQEEE